MSRKSLSKSESAAAIAIAAVLLLGLAFTIISVVKINYAPEWKIDAERDYSYDAWSSMEDVKTEGEIFTRFMESDINYPYGLYATIPFSMGGGDVPVFEPSKSNSKLAVNNENCTMIITLANHSDDPRIIDCGGITYYSENRQYPNQIFRYENGALILAQDNNSQMKHDPLFNISEAMGNYTVTINAVSLTGEPESISSSTLTALRLTGYSVDTEINSDVYKKANENIGSFNLTIYTHYTDAWTAYLNNMAKDAKLKYGINYTINSTDDYVYLSFLPTCNKNYNVYVNKTVLCAELGRKGEGGVPYSGNTEKSERIWYPFEKASGIYLNPISVDYTLLQNYNSTFILPLGNPLGEELNSYYPYNEFTYNLENNNKDLNLNLGFNNNTAFESAPTSVTVKMIYRYEKSETELPSLTMGFTGGELKTIIPRENWSLYKDTFSVPSASSLADLKFSLGVNTGSKGQGILRIDYIVITLD